MSYLLGLDLGSSSVKAALLDAQTGCCVGSGSSPADEMAIDAPRPGFAEQSPSLWKEHAIRAIEAARQSAGVTAEDIAAIGIAYQMHGLVCVDADGEVLRPAIIWCDSRATAYGARAFEELGPTDCLAHYLNSPGNFTAAKLAWVKENEPGIYSRIARIMLPGDWLASELGGVAGTTASGLSEAILWDFQQEQLGHSMLAQFGFDPEIIPELLPSFGPQGEVGARAAAEFGLAAGTPISYRGGDQPNNALSLNVLQPGEVAATAGTSGVVYGVADRKDCDPQSRFNTFLHLNHTPAAPRLGHLLCINGTGIMNSWLRRLLGGLDYEQMNALAAAAEVGARGLSVLPFGNGAERMLGNRSPGAALVGLDLNRHGRPEICRAAQEGIAFAFKYGMDIMASSGIELSRIRAGRANMFLSEIFGTTLAGVSGATIELYNTDGAQGAARGAGVGAGIYSGLQEAFANLKRLAVIEPAPGEWQQAYVNWKQELEKRIQEI